MLSLMLPTFREYVALTSSPALLLSRKDQERRKEQKSALYSLSQFWERDGVRARGLLLE
jgi:hypothetical protein